MSLAISGVGTQVKLGPSVDTVPPLTFTLLGELASMTPRGRQFDVNDVTSFTSPTKAKEKIKGLLNPGQYDLVGNRIFDDASQIALNVAFRDPRPYWFQVWLPPNPGQLTREIWQFAALVLSIDPPKIAPNKALQFFSKLQATGARLSFKGMSNATASIGYTQSRPIGNNVAAVLWGGFQLASHMTMPSDAEIQGIYPVIVASANYDGAFQYLQYKNGITFGDNLNTNFASPSPAPGLDASFGSTEFVGASIGTDLSALAGQNIQAMLQVSLMGDARTDTLNVNAVAYAIDYTSSAPFVDPQIPPPFAVSSGHGLAWALPATVMQSGNLPGCGGLLCPSTGFAFGTASEEVFA